MTTGGGPPPGDRPVVRPAVPADAAAVARVQVATWRDAYRGIVPDAFLDGMREEEWAARRSGNLRAADTVTLVAEDAGGIVGFAFAGPAREGPLGFDAELYAIYVLPDRQRRRLGRRLVLRLAEALAVRGFRALYLWVLRDNARARAFYERLGGRVVDAKDLEIGGASLPEVAYGWGDLAPLLDLRVRLVPPDPAWAAAFARERTRIAAALGDDAAGIEQIGSTAVPGLEAKPVIDVLLGLRGFPLGDGGAEALRRLGWTPCGDGGIPGRQYFVRGVPRRWHLHACAHDGKFWRDHLAFRDALRADPALAREYGELKARLAADLGDDRVAYTEAKSPFIGRVLRGARAG